MKQAKAAAKLVTAAQAELHAFGSAWKTESPLSVNNKTIPQAVSFMLQVLADEKSPIPRAMVTDVFHVWADVHKKEINLLADCNGGRQKLSIGVMSIIEASHFAAFMSSRPREKPVARVMSHAEAVAKIKAATPSEEEKESGFKRPRPKASPDSTLAILECHETVAPKVSKPVPPPKRQTPSLLAVVNLRQEAFDGKVIKALTASGIRYQSVVDGVREARVFIGGLKVALGVGKRYAGTEHTVNIPETHAIPGLGEESDNTLFVHELRSTFTSKPEADESRHGVHGLKVIGVGTYNIVASAFNSERLPPVLQNQNFVLRIPRPDVDGIPFNEGCKELHAMLVAAHGGFGPRVLWAFVQVSTLDPLGKETCRVFAALESLQVSLQATLHSHFEAPNIMSLLCHTVFDISVRNLVGLDAKLDNFMVRKQHDGRVTDVLAIDFDSQLFRHLAHDTDPRVALAFNLLYVGVYIRSYAPTETWKAWLSQPVGNGTMLSFVTSLVHGLNGREHAIARVVWCKEALHRWTPRDHPGDAYAASDALAIVFYYFVHTSFTEGLEVAKKIKAGSRQGVKHFQKMLGPTMRFFVERLERRDRLLRVLLDYWSTPIVPFPPGNRYDTSAALCGDSVRPFAFEILDEVERK